MDESVLIALSVVVGALVLCVIYLLLLTNYQGRQIDELIGRENKRVKESFVSPIDEGK